LHRLRIFQVRQNDLAANLLVGRAHRELGRDMSSLEMRRRRFILLLCGVAAGYSVPAYAQNQTLPVVGFLSSLSAVNATHLVAAFHRGLVESGFTPGQNVSIDYRWAGGRYDQLPSLAAELIARPVTVLVSTGGGPTLLAAKAATTTTPVVFVTGTDPVTTGAVASIRRPAGNFTGVLVLTQGLEQKRLGLLRELVPANAAIAVLVNPTNPGVAGQRNDIEAAARQHSQEVHIFDASNEREIDVAFEAIGRLRPGALLVASDPYLSIRREQLVALAARCRIPTMYQWREFALAGGLMSYGTSLAEGYHEAGVYTGKILNGAKPADMPVLQPTKFELVINLKTANTLGVTIPPGVLAIADEVVE
jgi:putative ABC transport system substrate-binding protein